MTPREELLAAADLIRTHGWCRHKFVDSIGRHCIIGAISEFRGDGFEAINRLCDVVGNIVDFNDDHCRDKHDAIAALEIAADLAA